MQQCKNELQIISAHMIHQKDNILPDNCNISHLYLHLRYQQSQNLKIMAQFGLLNPSDVWRHADGREQGWTFWMQSLAWDAEFRKSSLLYKEMQVFERCAFHLAFLSMESLSSRDTYLNLLIALKSRNLFFNYFTFVFSKTEVTWKKMVYFSKGYYFSNQPLYWYNCSVVNRTDFTSRKQWFEVGFEEYRTVKHLLLLYTGKLWMQCWFQ